MQLETGNNISIIDEKTWKAIRKPYLALSRKVACSVCGNKLIFRGQITVNVSVSGKLVKVKVYVWKNDTPNLFGTDWIELFDLGDLPVSLFYNYMKITSPSTNMVDQKF